MNGTVRAFAGASFLVSSLVSASAAASPDEDPVAAFDVAWAGRSEGARGGTARESSVAPALAAIRSAVAADPDSLAARWRLMRALYFLGEHATTGDAAKREVFDEGKKLGDATLDLIRRKAGTAASRDLSKASPVELVPLVKSLPDATPCFLWAGVNWGKWALVFGKTAAARQGAAARIRDYATAVVRLDPAYDEGGGYRVLGRLHHQTPAIPFVTGWASRSEALKNLRLAVETAPRNFVNRLYLAEAMHQYERERRREAVRMLEALVAETPSAALAVEDARAQEDARALLAAWAKE